MNIDLKNIGVCLMLVLSMGTTAAPPQWDLSDLYASLDSWDSAREEVSVRITQLQDCEGRLTANETVLQQCMDTVFATYRDLLRLYSYITLARDTDLGNDALKIRASAAHDLLIKFRDTTAYLDREIPQAGSRTIDRYMEKNPALENYSFFFREALRKSGHQVPPDREMVLTAIDNAQQLSRRIFTTLSEQEIPWPSVKLSDGSSLHLDSAGYRRGRELPSAADRKRVFSRYFDTYQQYRETFALTLEGYIRGEVEKARLRSHPSALAAKLAQENIPEAVYRALLDATAQSLDTFHRYLGLRNRIMGLEQSAYSDLYPLAATPINHAYSLEQARSLTVAALTPLGEYYLGALREAMDQGWVHSAPGADKYPGTYVLGAAYDVHPYLLLNFQGDFDSLMSYGREWGHAMHSLLANRNQPFAKADFADFLSEIPATVNEILLYDHLAENAGSVREKLAILSAELQALRSRFFRQAQLAEFELAANTHVQNGGTLSGDMLNSLYGDILKRYYGHDEGVVAIDDRYSVEWAHIPLFYRGFAVYRYPASIGAAYALAEKIASGETGREQYLNILRAGGSDYPYNILLEAGVDMADPAVYGAVIRRMNRLLDEIETTLKAMPPPTEPGDLP